MFQACRLPPPRRALRVDNREAFSEGHFVEAAAAALFLRTAGAAVQHQHDGLALARRRRVHDDRPTLDTGHDQAKLGSLCGLGQAKQDKLPE